jgi:hypothetical protein
MPRDPTNNCHCEAKGRSNLIPTYRPKESGLRQSIFGIRYWIFTPPSAISFFTSPAKFLEIGTAGIEEIELETDHGRLISLIEAETAEMRKFKLKAALKIALSKNRYYSTISSPI